MSPASKSKPNDKKASKEPLKSSSKPSGPASTSNGVPASAYNPLSGTFHTLEVVPTSSASPIHTNGRFRNIDETDDLVVGPLGGGVECDSASNNGSWSGESEDQKERCFNAPLRQEPLPGADNDKREKIRQKNERKHQRQKERRAQELHERCSGYLMSRKLEALAQQLVAMGFLHERATMALILNEGKLEESVSWLFEEGEDPDRHWDQNLGGGNLRIDISEELAQIADMEIRYKCTKQEVERAVVAFEGDLKKAAESLKAIKLDLPSCPIKPGETGDPPTASCGKLSLAGGQNVSRIQPKPEVPSIAHQRRDDKDFVSVKTTIPVGGSSESVSKSMLPLKRIQPKLEWAKPQPSENQWPIGGSNPSVSFSLASPLLVSSPQTRMESLQATVGNEYKNLQPGTVREPVVIMQQPQSANAKQVPATNLSTSPGTTVNWYPNNGIDIMKPNSWMAHIQRNPSPNCLSSNQMFHQLHCERQRHLIAGSSSLDSSGTSRGNSLWSRVATPSTIAAASSLGLFSGLGSTGSSGASSPVDWSTAGSMAQLDYTSIDWSLDRGLSSSKHSGLWLGSGSLRNGTQVYDSSTSGLGAKLTTRSAPSGNGVPIAALQDGMSGAETSAGTCEWTSPFEGKDLFSSSRQFVSSPSL